MTMVEGTTDWADIAKIIADELRETALKEWPDDAARCIAVNVHDKLRQAGYEIRKRSVSASESEAELQVAAQIDAFIIRGLREMK